MTAVRNALCSNARRTRRDEVGCLARSEHIQKPPAAHLSLLRPGMEIANDLQKKMYEVRNITLPSSNGKSRKKEKKMQIMVGTMGLQIFKKGSGRLSATFLYQHLRTWNAKLDGLMIVTMDGQEHFFYTESAAEIGVAMRDEAMKIKTAIQAAKADSLGEPVWEEDPAHPVRRRRRRLRLCLYSIAVHRS